MPCVCLALSAERQIHVSVVYMCAFPSSLYMLNQPLAVIPLTLEMACVFTRTDCVETQREGITVASSLSNQGERRFSNTECGIYFITFL